MPSSHKGLSPVKWILESLVLATLVIQLSSALGKKAFILVSPQSRNVTLDRNVIALTCNATAEGISYSINGINADHISIQSLGFHQETVETVAPGVLERTLTVQVSPSIDSSIIVCRAFTIISSVSEDISDPADIRIQGPLAKPGDLTHEIIKEDHMYVDITWTPPPTLMGTTILGYNITVDGLYSMFTEDTQARVNLSEIISCEPVNVNISAYNGVDGELVELRIIVPSIPAEDTYIPVNYVNKTEESDQKERPVFLTCNVSNLCEGQKPTDIRVTIMDTDNKTEHEDYYSLKTVNSSKEIRISNDTIKLDEDKEYRINVTFRNNGGWFKNVSTIFNIHCMNGSCGDHLPTIRTGISTDETAQPTPSTPNFNNATQAGAKKHLVFILVGLLLAIA